MAGPRIDVLKEVSQEIEDEEPLARAIDFAILHDLQDDDEDESQHYSRWTFFEYLSDHYKKDDDNREIQKNILIETTKLPQDNNTGSIPVVITNALKNYQYDIDTSSKTIYTTLLDFWISMTTITSDKDKIYDEHKSKIDLYTFSRAEEYINYLHARSDLGYKFHNFRS